MGMLVWCRGGSVWCPAGAFASGPGQRKLDAFATRSQPYSFAGFGGDLVAKGFELVDGTAAELFLVVFWTG
ncbi:MAG TPA: hypothetical protein VGO16_00425 [Pseudonocardiaceae bacterium]|jgi:hypothetical protein|nr:hypothetical protein [Pseudonocardiaceae bacterium]